MELSELDHRLLASIEDGLPLVPRPYTLLGRQLGVDAGLITDRLRALQATGAISRFGVVVRHRALGYRANAMVVWDVPTGEETDRVGRLLAGTKGVTLCYQRPRRLPQWPYNLFSMVHGRSRAEVGELVGEFVDRHSLQHLPHALLFSRRCFKQRGARYYGAVQPATASTEARP